MSHFEFESYSEGEWDEQSELSWNEFDWQRFLMRHEEEVSRFNSFYNSSKGEPGRIDKVAHFMGWDADDWSATDAAMDEHTLPYCEGTPDHRVEEEEDTEDTDPYTIHRHPIFVVTRGIYLDLDRIWENFLESASCPLEACEAWHYGRSLHEGQLNAMLGVQALDMGDYPLTVSQYKLALKALNQSLAILQSLPPRIGQQVLHLCRESHIRLFDLREVWLRVMCECREEIDRRSTDRD